MRRAYNDVTTRLDTTHGSKDFGRIWGISLGHNFCAEHEWGITPIQRSFGIADDISVYGIKRRKITRVPKAGLRWVERGGRSGILFEILWYASEEEAIKNLWNQLSLGTAKPGLATAWDESSFLVTSDDPGEVWFLRELHGRFGKKDVVIGLLRTFVGVNFLLAIASLIPPGIRKSWEEADRENHKVQKEFKKSGIEKLLRDRGKRYFALGPRHAKDGSLEFWLNPMEQDDNNFGWFKLEDLREWAEGGGRIPKKAKPEEKP